MDKLEKINQLGLTFSTARTKQKGSWEVLLEKGESQNKSGKLANF